MNRAFEVCLAHYRERWAAHTLELHAHVPGRVTTYYLRDTPKMRAQSCYLAFTPEAIVITGDWSPGRNGAVSALGYSEAWFSGPLSHRYVAEKFLEKSWQPVLGFQQMQRRIVEARRSASISRRAARLAFDAVCGVPASELSEYEAHRIFYELAGLSDWECLGRDYDPNDHALLCAIQERFVVCKAQMAVAA